MLKLLKSFQKKKELSMFFILLFSIFIISINKFNYKNFPFAHNKDLIQVLRNQDGLILSSLGVHGYENFNILSYTTRPYYSVNKKLIRLNDEDKIIIDVYCNASVENIYLNKLRKQKKCFSSRTPELWKYIGKYLGAKSLIVNHNISLNLPLLIETKNFKLYNIE